MVEGEAEVSFSDRKTAVLKTDAIRGTYRRAVLGADGEWIRSSGYTPDDRIGNAILDTVAGLCDEVDALREDRARMIAGINEQLEAARAKDSAYGSGLRKAFCRVLVLFDLEGDSQVNHDGPGRPLRVIS